MDLKILISAPTDQDVACKKVMETISSLNKIMEPHGHSLKAVHWKDNIASGRADRAQTVINSQVEDCNALIVILGSRVGSPTGEFASGTIEEFFNFLEKNPKSGIEFDVHVLFNDIGEKSIYEIDPEQLKAVQDFRNSLNGLGVNFNQFSTYETLQELASLGLSTLIAKEKPFHDDSENDPLHEFDELGFDDAMEIANTALTEATQNLNEIGSCVSSITDDLARVNKIHDSDNTDTKQHINNISDVLNSLASKLSPLAESFKKNINHAYSHQNLAVNIAIEDFDSSETKTELIILRDAITSAMSSTTEFLDSTIATRDTIQNIPRRTSKLIKSKKRAVSVYNGLIATVEASVKDFLALANTLPSD